MGVLNVFGPSRLNFANLAEVHRLNTKVERGLRTSSWQKINTIVDRVHGIPGELYCRIDTGYFRAGRDAPAAVASPNTTMRSGLVLCDYTTGIIANDRLVFISGPVTGTFELRTPPDVAQSFLTPSHLEFYVYEVSKSESRRDYPEVEAGD